MQICIFEDTLIKEFDPLTATRPVYLLRFGTSDLLTKLLHYAPKAKIVLHCRKELESILSEKLLYPVNTLAADDTIFINGRLLGDSTLAATLQNIKHKKNTILTKSLNPLVAHVDKNKLKNFSLPALFTKTTFAKLKLAETASSLQTADHFWDLISLNGAAIKELAELSKNLGKHLSSYKEAVLLEPKNIYIGKNVKFGAGVVLDGTKGAVYLEDGVEIMHNAVVIGPAYLGERSIVKIGAKIYGNTTIGPVCKVGGEIEGSIFQGYSNKQHEGFLGHSFIGEWVNLGAGTENSDLKNNYTDICVTLNNKEINSKQQFVGCCIGDHTKTGIKTMISAGSIFGCFCNIYGAGYQPKNLANFKWHDNNGKTAGYKLPQALETAKKVMSRRNVPLSNSLRKLYTKIHG
jgi:UDP-N-acetylglucosamine diphosphorylase/glucosamine-1-phosphate N-acetyltransferase